jgi:hypothetical protein
MQRPPLRLMTGGNPRQHPEAGHLWGQKQRQFLGHVSSTRTAVMGRPKTQGKCKIKACGNDAASRDRCWTHYKQWERAYGHLRCHWPDCRSHQDDGGRRMNGVFYCRRHESAHLRITPQAHELNSQRLGHGLTADANGCWLWGGAKNDHGYGLFVPEGANIAEWYTHRVAWDLLVGGHKPRLQLDHRTCKRRHCVNPLHLDPVTPETNQKRKHSSPEWGWINTNAASLPNIHEFAARHGLPVPSSGAPTISRKTPCSTPAKLPAKPESSTRRTPTIAA